MSQPQLFFLVEMFLTHMSVPVIFHLHNETLSTIKYNHQKTNFQLLSRIRCISGNGFVILGNRWRVFRRPFMQEPETVKTVTLASIHPPQMVTRGK